VLPEDCAVDCVLASHYGLTAEELDFVVNYDIKYRLGRAARMESVKRKESEISHV
jgi:hypothetical protein